jgi:DNA polymerase III alpha subunit
MAYLKANYSKEFYATIFNGVTLGSPQYVKLLKGLKYFNFT